MIFKQLTKRSTKGLTAFISIVILIASLFISGLTEASDHARGVLSKKHIDAEVDSEVARYYLQEYLSGVRHKPALDSDIDSLLFVLRGTVPSRRTMKSIAERYSVDFAALVLTQSILEDSANNKAQQRYEVSMQSDAERDIQQHGAGFTLLFVAGWDYVESGNETGADFAAPRKLLTTLGIDNRLIAIDPTGTVENNAAVIATALVAATKKRTKVILVSASSGGPATALALGQILTSEQAASVKAWVNIGGILQGSPVADYYLESPVLLRIALLVKGWSIESIRSMAARVRRERNMHVSLPSNMLIVNFVGIPLSGQVTDRAREMYDILSPMGPNDGLTLIVDAMAQGGVTIVDIGADHFFGNGQEISKKTVALTTTVLRLLGDRSNTTADFELSGQQKYAHE